LGQITITYLFGEVTCTVGGVQDLVEEHYIDRIEVEVEEEVEKLC
jgi:hypothetical protein